jgi:hypothetical protein
MDFCAPDVPYSRHGVFGGLEERARGLAATLTGFVCIGFGQCSQARRLRDLPNNYTELVCRFAACEERDIVRSHAPSDASHGSFFPCQATTPSIGLAWAWCGKVDV